MSAFCKSECLVFSDTNTPSQSPFSEHWEEFDVSFNELIPG